MAALTEPRGRMLLAALALWLVSVPVLSGGWVYDDVHMVGNPAMDDPSDVLAVFTRTSADYLGGAHAGGTETRTWRPVTMLTLVATQVVWASPIAHHLVGWLLHCGLVALLLGAERRRATAWTLAVVALAFHPALAEAWLYINGRSDLVAGLCLVALWRACRGRGRARVAAVLALSVAGVLAKETFLCAAPFVVLAAARPRGRTSRWVVAAAALGLLVAIALAVLSRPQLGAEGSAARLLDPRMIARWPALVGLAAESLALPLPRAMRSLAHELGPDAMFHVPWLVLPVAVAGLLAVKKKVRPLVHLLGAVATLLPTVLVSDIFWLGFDRYLYMPAVLVATACATELQTVTPTRRAWGVGLALGAVLGLACALGSLPYRSRDAFDAAILEERPGDPAGYLLVASRRAELGNLGGAFELLSRLPVEHLTGATAHRAAAMLHELGRPDLVVAVLEEAHRREPDHPFLEVDMIGLRGAQGRFDEAFDLAARLRATPGYCELARGALEPFERSDRLPPPARARALELRAPCE